MTESGVVVAAEGDRAVVRFERSAMCDKCGMCKGEKAEIELFRPDWVSVGDRVSVALPGSRILAASALTYVMPLALLFVGLLAGQTLGGELTGAIAALVCAALGFLLMKALDPALRRSGFFNPRIVGGAVEE